MQTLVSDAVLEKMTNRVSALLCNLDVVSKCLADTVDLARYAPYTSLYQLVYFLDGPVFKTRNPVLIYQVINWVETLVWDFTSPYYNYICSYGKQTTYNSIFRDLSALRGLVCNTI